MTIFIAIIESRSQGQKYLDIHVYPMALSWPMFFIHDGIVLNPFTLTVPLGRIVCYFRSFENNLGIKQKFTKYLKESFCLTSGQHFSFKYFPKNAFVRNIFSKLLGLFWPL